MTHGRPRITEQNMADKLDVNTGGTAAGDKIWEMHQKDEQKAVNNHKEGHCWNCEKRCQQHCLTCVSIVEETEDMSLHLSH